MTNQEIKKAVAQIIKSKARRYSDVYTIPEKVAYSMWEGIQEDFGDDYPLEDLYEDILYWKGKGLEMYKAEEVELLLAATV